MPPKLPASRIWRRIGNRHGTTARSVAFRGSCTLAGGGHAAGQEAPDGPSGLGWPVLGSGPRCVQGRDLRACSQWPQALPTPSQATAGSGRGLSLSPCSPLMPTEAEVPTVTDSPAPQPRSQDGGWDSRWGRAQQLPGLWRTVGSGQLGLPGEVCGGSPQPPKEATARGRISSGSPGEGVTNH